MTKLLFLNLGVQELIILPFTLIPLALMIYSIVDLMKRNFSGKSVDQILIFLLVIFAPIIGSIVYLLLIRENYALKNKRASF